MSVYIKGGAWTNVEDEVLKAAVSKYGLNQWDRVASLLTKKNAKQAKARWNEWLSPAVNRTLWTKEQDSNLLSLAKLFPNQWKSVAGALGRTATQCAERYDRLLAIAAGEADAEDDDEETQSLRVTGPGIETLPAKGPSLSKETNYEAKPSLPDEEHMDDDEREMLSEARARLANTKGKKAKRKERERMLEESRRVALLQKRRELKAAGILMSLVSKNKRAKKEFDYVNDIPHEIAPATGLYDVSEEAKLNEKESKAFQGKVRKEGIDLNTKSNADKEARKHQDKEKKQIDKKHKLSIEAAAQLVDEFIHHESKRRKIELSEPVNLPLKHGTHAHQFDSSVEHLKSALKDSREAVQQQDIVDQDNVVDDLILEKSRAILNEKANEAMPLLLSLSERQEHPKSENNVDKPVKKPVRIRLYVVKFLKENFTKLPQPRKHLEPVSDILVDSDDDAVSVEDYENDKGERLRNLNLLVKVDQELSKLRRTQAVQRGLPIPDPRLFNKDVASKLEGLEKSIADEFFSLVKSDYTKYEDVSYGGEIVDDLDEDSFKLVNTEISKEISESVKSSLNTEEPAKLPLTTAAASSAIELFHKLEDENKALAEKIAKESGFHEFEDRLVKLMNDIHEAYVEVIQATTINNGNLAIAEEEQKAISNRSAYWNELAETVSKDEKDVVARYRQVKR